jgi:S1-C subfamily serine protease
MTPPETRPREPVRIRSRSPLAGATLLNMSPAVADELQIDVSPDGIVVADLEDNSVAQRVGFQKGDLVVAINGQRLATTKDAERLVRTGGQYWEITINRGGRVFTTVLGG